MKSNPAESFAEIVRAHQGLVFSVAVGILLDREEAMEVVQETFLKACGEPAFLADDFHRAGWLVKTARNMALNVRRSLMRRFRHWCRRALPAPVSPVKGFEEALIREEELEHLRRLMQDLSDEERTLLTLRYAAGYSYQQLADELNIKIGTVMSRLSRLKERLGAAMEDLPEESS
jgi:RNA polymerase sigma-70 factor (ECF subfamily)